MIRFRSRLLSPLILLFAAWLAAVPARAAEAGVETTWRLLDYIAVDYREAVAGGRVVNQFEYDEMLEFSNSVAARIGSLPAGSSPARLEVEAAQVSR